MSVNKTTLVGNVGKDPEVKKLGSGTSVARFTIATNETFKNKEGKKVTSTEWHQIVAWGKLAEIVEKIVKKGQLVYLEGSLKTREYDDKDNVKRKVTEINAVSLNILSKKGADAPEETESIQASSDDLPVHEG